VVPSGQLSRMEKRRMGVTVSRVLLFVWVTVVLGVWSTSWVLQCSDGLSNKLSNSIRTLMDNMKLLLICILRVLLSYSFIFFRFYFLSMYIWFYSCLIMQLTYFYCYDYVFSLYVYVWLPWLRFFRAFSSVVRQMPG